MIPMQSLVQMNRIHPTLVRLRPCTNPQGLQNARPVIIVKAMKHTCLHNKLEKTVVLSKTPIQYKSTPVDKSAITIDAGKHKSIDWNYFSKGETFKHYAEVRILIEKPQNREVTGKTLCLKDFMTYEKIIFKREENEVVVDGVLREQKQKPHWFRSERISPALDDDEHTERIA